MNNINNKNKDLIPETFTSKKEWTCPTLTELSIKQTESASGVGTFEGLSFNIPS